MAVTKSLSEVLTIAKVGRQQEDDQAGYIVTAAMTELWKAYDWRETLAYLPPFYLIPGEQDYTDPLVTIPTDFRGLRKAYLVQTFANPPFRPEIEVIKDVRLTGALSLPTQIGYEPTISGFRLFPRVPYGIGAMDYLIDGTYKKRAPVYASTDLTGDMVFDDEYFPVLVAGVKWAAYTFNDDPRATRKFQDFHMLIDEMASAEGLDLGDPTIAPAEPLASVGMGNFHGPLLFL
jgi:hypothetical protein